MTYMERIMKLAGEDTCGREDRELPYGVAGPCPCGFYLLTRGRDANGDDVIRCERLGKCEYFSDQNQR